MRIRQCERLNSVCFRSASALLRKLRFVSGLPPPCLCFDVPFELHPDCPRFASVLMWLPIYFRLASDWMPTWHRFDSPVALLCTGIEILMLSLECSLLAKDVACIASILVPFAVHAFLNSSPNHAPYLSKGVAKPLLDFVFGVPLSPSSTTALCC